jgi:sec-independent protein translocase protein TatC
MRTHSLTQWRIKDGVISLFAPWIVSALWGDAEDPESEQYGKMSFLDHLDELRRRLIVSIVAVSAAFFICWAFRGKVFELVTIPITSTTGKELIYLTPAEPLNVYMQISLTAGVFLASPVILWQVWLFISPGLYRREKRFALPFLGATTVLFLVGGAFGYRIALPLTLRFLLAIGVGLESNVTAAAYLDFALTMILSCAVLFEIPVVIFFLTILGLVTARVLIRHLRYAILIIFITAAFITPSQDIPTMMVFALPTLALYLVGILVAWIFRRKPCPQFGENEKILTT